MMKYEKYKPSEVQLLEHIPEHWGVKRNKDFCLIKGRIGFRGYTKDDYVDAGNGALVIGATEMNENGYIKVTNPQYISWFKYYESPEIILETNDILVVQRGSTVGKVTIVDESIQAATINPSLVILKKIKINNKFLLFYLMSASVQGFIKAQTATTAIPMITQDQIGKYEICIPTNQEQTAIAQYLDAKTQAIDKKINLLTKKADYYKELRKSIINDAVCKGLDKNVKLKESGIYYINSIPVHWKVERIKDQFYIGRGRVIGQEALVENGEYPVYSSQTENNGCLGFIETFDFDKDLLTWTTDGANAGTVFRRSGKFNCTNVCGTLIPKKKNLDLNYVVYALQESATHNKRIDTNGAKIMNNEMAVIHIAFPPKEEQTAIANYLDEKTKKIDAIVNNIGKQIDTLKELRKTLINDVVTGKIKVTANGNK